MKGNKKLMLMAGMVLSLSAASALADNMNVQILSAVVKDQRIPGATVIVQKNGATSVTSTTNAQGLATVTPALPTQRTA